MVRLGLYARGCRADPLWDSKTAPDQQITEAMKQWLWDSVFIDEDQRVALTFVFKLDH